VEAATGSSGDVPLSIFGSLLLPPSPDDHRRVLAVVKFLDAH
jgi:hypothetical protein